MKCVALPLGFRMRTPSFVIPSTLVARFGLTGLSLTALLSLIGMANLPDLLVCPDRLEIFAICERCFRFPRFARGYLAIGGQEANAIAFAPECGPSYTDRQGRMIFVATRTMKAVPKSGVSKLRTGTASINAMMAPAAINRGSFLLRSW